VELRESLLSPLFGRGNHERKRPDRSVIGVVNHLNDKTVSTGDVGDFKGFEPAQPDPVDHFQMPVSPHHSDVKPLGN
jgi:hypothetical protein